MAFLAILLLSPAFALGCNPGASECVGNASFHTCTEHAVWGETVSCLAGQQCIDGQCQEPIGCKPGTSECVGSASYHVCNNYALWGPETGCQQGYLCSGGQCYNPMPKQCDTPGQTRCNPSGSGEVQVCNGDFQWAHKQSCDYGCQSGYCLTCRPGNTRCAGTYTYQTCNGDGSAWGSDTRCPNNLICDGGSCVADPSLQCNSIGAFRCSPSSSPVLQRCGNNYQWSDFTYCSMGCSSGACKACNYGDRKCKDFTSYLNCGSGGQWGGETSCPDGYFCYSGSCQVPSGSQCSSQGATRCSPDNPAMVQICNSNYIYSDYQQCSQGCVNGACAECKAGTSACVGTSSVKTCGTGGKYAAAQPCATGYACTGGNCVKTAVCSAGQRACMSNSVYACVDGQWASYLSCPSDSTCVESQGTAFCQAKPQPAPTPEPQPSPSPSGGSNGMLTEAALAGLAILVVGGGYFLLAKKKKD
jgi:hypothetical protein